MYSLISHAYIAIKMHNTSTNIFKIEHTLSLTIIKIYNKLTNTFNYRVQYFNIQDK
jgi:hypothetical protein